MTTMAGLLLLVLGETVEVCVGGGELNGGERIADETDGSMVRRGGRCNISGGRGVSDNVTVLNGCFCKRLCYFLHFSRVFTQNQKSLPATF